MKILHTVEYYFPHLGGAQEVVRQLSERLVERGHEVTVATTKIPLRKTKKLNGVNIEDFDIQGNAVRGMYGEVERYQRFLVNEKFDVMMNYAAQQWATDAVFPVLRQISSKKVLIPCGFSGLYKPEYVKYFDEMPSVLRQYDHLVFPADNYRDTKFVRQHGIHNWSLIPNGASNREFSVIDPTFRARHGIPSEAIMLLTVGSHTGIKGHRLMLEALKRINIDKKIVLVIIGNRLAPIGILESIRMQLSCWRSEFWPIVRIVQKAKVVRVVEKLWSLWQPLLWGGLPAPGCIQDCRMRVNHMNFMGPRNRRAILLSPSSNEEVVAAYHAADLFIFGSNIEHSPLVLFQSMASKTPFLSLACGNAAEIVEWSKGGKIAPTIPIKEGMVDGDPEIFANEITTLLENPSELTSMAENGYAAWQGRFTWEKIVLQYEDLYRRLVEEK